MQENVNGNLLCRQYEKFRTMAFVLDNKVENLLDRFKVRDDFLRDYLDKKRKPGTSKHYISSLISFMDFAISDEVKITRLHL